MNENSYFIYGKREIEYLKAKDAALGSVIDTIGELKRPVIPDLYEALINSILGQQISTKALDTVWRRFKNQFTPITAEHIYAFEAEELQTIGISLRKAGYIKEISRRIAEKEFNLSELHNFSDEEVCKRLSELPGIGIWTAEMLMTFSMQRPDIISFGDLAILRGMRMLYHHRRITPDLFAKYKRRYSPYATVASLYLWAVSAGAIEGMKDYAPKIKNRSNSKKERN